MTEYTPCPTCHQYSHSIGEDRVTDAFVHFQSMIDYRGDGMLTQSAFGEQTRDYAQVLVAEITRLRADRNAVIRECAEIVANCDPLMVTLGSDFEPSPSTTRAYATMKSDAVDAILELIEGDE